jgi:hypothetical protein
MTLVASVGSAQALDGREAGLQAAHQALNRMGASAPNFAIIISSHQYQAREVLNGVTSLLGDVPILGFSSPYGLTHEGQHPHSVVVALLSGDFQADSLWFSGYSQSSRDTSAKLTQYAAEHEDAQSMLFFADGFNGDADQLCNMLSPDVTALGGLSSGDLYTGNTYLIAGNHTGSGALAAAFLRGNLKMGVGAAHGWEQVSKQFRVTRSRGFWLRTLDSRPASETYATLFGYPARDWAFPPLNYLARLYPLGVEQGNELIVRSPIRVEADGSFRMNATIRDGIDAYLLVGSRVACERAAHEAVQQALLQLGKAKPVFALLLVDIAWQLLLKDQAGLEVSAVQDILGTKIPIAGGYTLGQVIPADGASPKFLNQHMVVIIFGEETSK